MALTEQDNIILDYLARRGHTQAEQALRQELGLSLADYASRNAPSPALPLKKSQSQQLLADPPAWELGYQGLRDFVENSLDIHRPELLPLLLPVFLHSYLDLLLANCREAADAFLHRFQSDHQPAHPQLIRLLTTLRLPHHLTESEQAARWRNERYHLTLSDRGWGLLLGWLQGGKLAATIEGTESRGRDRVLAIINERVNVDTQSGPPPKNPAEFGLFSDLNTSSDKRSAAQRSLDPIKLGPAPLDPKFEREIARRLRDDQPNPDPTAPFPPLHDTNSPQMGQDGAITQDAQGTLPKEIDFAQTASSTNTLPLAPLVTPFPTEGPPYPSMYRTVDVAREVEKVREARKRIGLGAGAFQEDGGPGGRLTVGAVMGADDGKGEGAAKPSVCLFTIHDAGDSLTTISFSEDSTLMAAGFSESYIRLWNLKGGKLSGIRTDFDSDAVNDSSALRKLKDTTGPTSRKLIAHSGPVYALSFDPVPGSSAPPRYLLSASHDTTIRLWSLETYKNLMVYRGHREPVWDVQWGPRGIYFASASRDRTARIWISDKVAAVRIFVGHLSDVNCVQFHPNSLYLATGSSDRTCRLWDIQRGVCVRVFVGHKGSVSCLAISPDGRWLASGSHDQSIKLWNLTTGTCEKTFTGHSASLYSLSFSAESTLLISGSGDGTVRVWDVLAVPTVAGAAGTVVLGGRKKAEKEKKGKGNAGEGNTSQDLLVTLATKRTPILAVRFTPRNLCLAAGAIDSS